MPRLHHDGEFKSLEELVAGTISGRNLGWLPGEEEQAFNQVQTVLLQDKGGTKEVPYREQFKAAFTWSWTRLTEINSSAWFQKRSLTSCER